jgi:CO/xanthine dehydrogenase FAD-binding subunit
VGLGESIHVRDFEYVAPRTLSESVALLAKHGERARILAGGTDLLVQLREGRREADAVVDVKHVPELNELTINSQGLRIGAAVPCCGIYEHPEVVNQYPGLVDAVSLVGGIQIQSRASLGGNLCNASPAADGIPVLIALEGVCDIAGPKGTRSVPVEQFCTAPGKTVLGRGEFLVRFRFPPPKKQSGAAYLRFIPRNEMDIAVVGVGAIVQLDAAKS